MTARPRRSDAARSPSAFRKITAHELWPEAVQIRREWLGHGLSTLPSDRDATERCIAGLYARISRRKPRFEWVDSPYKALPLIAGWPTLDHLHRLVRDHRPHGTPPLASDLALVAARLRGALSDGVAHADPEFTTVRRGKSRQPWPELSPLTAFEQGVPLGVVLHQGIRTALYRCLATGFRQPVRAALTGTEPMPVCWYGQQDAPWIAYYDALERLGLARYGTDDAAHLAEWALLARSSGWWWPGEQVCVVVERPAIVPTEPVPGALHEEVRLRSDGLEYRDGWRPRPQ